MEDEQVIEEEKVAGPAADPNADAGGGAADPAAQDKGQPGVDRVIRERDEYREKSARLEGELAALKRGGGQEKNGQETFDEKADRELFEKDPYAWTRQQHARSEAQRTRTADLEAGSRLVESHPQFKKDPKFNDRIAEILDEAYPGDPDFKRTPCKVQMDFAVKQYNRLYGEKARAEIRTVPAGGKGSPTDDAKPTEVTVEMMQGAKKRWSEAPDRSGKGWGERQYEEWQRKGLLKMPAVSEE